ncbi:hypothetical protein Mapa_008557 [Marchantia paleacea]|nr:hypothetical protein Mapa_008557 [Marchantia paleacea]
MVRKRQKLPYLSTLPYRKAYVSTGVRRNSFTSPANGDTLPMTLKIPYSISTVGLAMMHIHMATKVVPYRHS